MGLAEWKRARRLRTPVEGVFRVIAVSSEHVGESGYRLSISGVVSAPGVPPTAVQDSFATRQVGSWPVADQEFSAQIDSTEPTRFLVRWSQLLDPHAAQVRGRDQAEQAAKAMRLGIDPSTLPPPPQRSTRLRDMYRDAVDERAGTTLLPDGRPQVTAAEADELCVVGEAATATITAIDYLKVDSRLMPGPGASIADVALTVHRADGTGYSTLSRFGFKNAARRAQIGFAGAEVPVRIDPADRARVVLDRDALQPLPD
jgi:hypothetical protein